MGPDAVQAGETIGRRVRLARLLDLYAGLLTDRQRQAVELYYGQDLSLGEIAWELGVSRQAVYDIRRRAEEALEAIEERVGMARVVERAERRIRLLEDALRRAEGVASRANEEAGAPLHKALRDACLHLRGLKRDLGGLGVVREPVGKA